MLPNLLNISSFVFFTQYVKDTLLYMLTYSFLSSIGSSSPIRKIGIKISASCDGTRGKGFKLKER